MAAVLEIKELAKQFKALRAVDDLNLSLEKGCVFGFLGQNGAGKTTTLRLITGLARPTEGEISVCGHKVQFGRGNTNRCVGYLPDVPQFYGWMTPEEYLVLCGKLQGLNQPDALRRAGELLVMVGLHDAKRAIKGFSRGMKQRLGIAQALVHNPELLLMDEPTSALDPLGRKEVMDAIQGLSGRHTVLFSTHILSDVERVCGRVGILHKGRLALEGPLEEVLNRGGAQGALLEIADPARHEELMKGLAELPWLSFVQSEGPGSYRLRTAQPQRLQRELCPLLAGLGIPIRRFEQLEASLEDVFMEVIGR